MRGRIERVSANKYRIVYDAPKGLDHKRRQKWETIYGNKKSAETVLAQRVLSIQRGEYIDSGKLTVRDLFARFLKGNEAKLAATTLQRYAGIVRNHIEPALGGIHLSQLSALNLEEAYSKWLQGGRIREKGGLSRRTVLHYHRLLHRVLGQAVKWKLVNHNVVNAVDPPKPEHREMRALTESQLAKLLNALETPPKHAIAQHGLSVEGAFKTAVNFIAFTGCRRGEALGLMWEDVNLKAGTVAIRRSLQEVKGKTFFKSTKSGKSRVIELSDYILRALQHHKAIQNAFRLALGNGYHDENLVFARSDGSPIRPQTFGQAFKALASRAGTPAIRLHELRHTHGTLLIKGGVHPKVASSRLGHSGVAITLDLYSHMLPGMDKQAAQQFEALVQGAKTKDTKSAC